LVSIVTYMISHIVELILMFYLYRKEESYKGTRDIEEVII